MSSLLKEVLKEALTCPFLLMQKIAPALRYGCKVKDNASFSYICCFQLSRVHQCFKKCCASRFWVNQPHYCSCSSVDCVHTSARTRASAPSTIIFDLQIIVGGGNTSVVCSFIHFEESPVAHFLFIRRLNDSILSCTWISFVKAVKQLQSDFPKQSNRPGSSQSFI